MKKIVSVISITIVLFSSCSEEIMDVENKNALTVDNFYETAADFEAALNSSYITLMERGMYALQMGWMVGTFEDRTLFETTSRDRLLTLSPTDENVFDVWLALYKGVYRTSMILQKMNDKGVDGISGMTQENYDYIAAQSKAIRGISYFYLTIFFDRPILYNETNVPDDYLADYGNANREDLWAQIEKDFTEAIPYLKLRSELSPEEFGRITKGAAMAQLAKSMLYKHYYYYERFGNGGSAGDLADLEIARENVRGVIDSKEYQLIQPQEPKTELDYIYAILCNTSFVDLPSENNMYDSENNIESVWEVQFGDDKAKDDNPWLNGYYGGGAQNQQWFSPHVSSYKNHEAHPLFYHVFETEGAPEPFDRDPRCKATFYMDGDMMDFNPESPYYKPFKSLLQIKRIAFARNIPSPEGYGLGIKKNYFPVYWNGLLAPQNDPVNKRVIRYADVLLMYAEVMYLLGDDGSGLEALNQVRQRVDMPTIDNLTTEAIIHERDIELAYECHRWFDLVRWSFSPEWGINWDEIQWGIDETNSINPFVVGKHEFYPFPLSEIDIHGGSLEQNPGW